jgi:hypothetical protein
VAQRLARHFTFGRSRVLTPVPSLTRCGFFFRGFPTPSHRGMSHIVISQIRRMLGQYQPLSTYHLPSAPILTVPIPNLPVSVAEKALETSAARPPSGEMKDENNKFFAYLFRNLNQEEVPSSSFCVVSVDYIITK